jgi:hypothetical protein
MNKLKTMATNRSPNEGQSKRGTKMEHRNALSRMSFTDQVQAQGADRQNNHKRDSDSACVAYPTGHILELEHGRLQKCKRFEG